VQQKQNELAAKREDIHIAANTDDLPSAFDTGNPASNTDKWHLAPESYEIAGIRLADYIAADFVHDFPVDSSGKLLLGDAGDNTLKGFLGNDTLDGAAGQDTLTGGLGADIFRFSATSHSIDDNGANDNRYDRITDFEVGVDKIDLTALGFTGFDTDGGNTEAGELRLSYSSSGKTYLRNDQTYFTVQLNGDYRSTLTASDILFGSAPPPPSTTLTGTSAANNLVGSSASEIIRGLAGDDSLSGNFGNDTLEGGAGRDKLTGGSGADVFRFTQTSDSTRSGAMRDRITDFEHGVDKIDVSGLGFTGISFGASSNAGQLRIHDSAATNRTYIRDDHGSDFELYLDGDYMSSLTASDFIFA
jgi:Ca2+-binding RTX toxin-like protein